LIVPRLLILCEYPTLLGGERSMLATLETVENAGFDTHVVAPSAGPLADVLRERGMPHVPWLARDAAGKRLPLSQLRETLHELVRHARPDVLHANSLSMARVSGPVAKHCGTASLGHLRDIVRLSRQAIDDLDCHTRLLAVSAATRDYHVAQGADAARVSVVHNGADLDAFRLRPATGYLHRGLRLPRSARLIVSIGQLGLRKATDILLTAAVQVAYGRSDVHWLVVGERTSDKQESRDFERLLHNIAATSPLAGQVHFLGTRDDIAQLMNEAAVLVHAARQEPLGRVLLEAAACGLPVVATDVGGTREIFPSEADGAVLVPADDRHALAEAIAALLNDESRRERLGRAARRRAEAAFDIRRTAVALVEHYRAVLGR
jgi:glycosyltransferase involved in cell wall biosynthesis